MFPDNGCHLLTGRNDDIQDKITKASLNGIYAIDMNHSIITKEIVDQTHSLSMEIYAYTVDDPIVAKRLIDFDVDGIETNCVSCLKKSMEEITVENIDSLSRPLPLGNGGRSFCKAY